MKDIPTGKPLQGYNEEVTNAQRCIANGREMQKDEPALPELKDGEKV